MVIDITFKIAGNNLVWQDIDEETEEFKAEVFCTNVEEKEVNGKKINWVQARLSYFQDDPSGDPTKKRGMVDIPNYEKLGKASSIGKEFTLVNFNEELLNTDCYELDGDGHGDLNIGRSTFYNIKFDITSPEVLNDNWKDETVEIDKLEPKSGDKDFTEINDKIEQFNQNLINNLWLNRFVSLYDACHSMGKYGMLYTEMERIVGEEVNKTMISEDFILNFKGKVASKVMNKAERDSAHPGNRGWFDIINPNSDYRNHIRSRKADYKKRSGEVQAAIKAAKAIVPRLEKMIDDWRKGGGLVDADYKSKLKKFNDTKDQIVNRYKTVKEKIEQEEKHKDLRTSWNTEISKVVDGVSANQDLEAAPDSIETAQFNKYFNDDAQKTKEQNKVKLIKLLKILGRKKKVAEMFETKMQGGRKLKCPQCNLEFDVLPEVWNGVNYCSQVCSEKAKQGGGSLSQTKTAAIQAINTALNQDPAVATSKLDADYRNWETKINGFSKAEEVNNFKDLVLANIKQKREKKKSNEKIDQLADNLSTKYGSELVNDLKDLADYEEKTHYQTKKNVISQAEDKAWTEDVARFKNLVKEIVETKMTKCGIAESELGSNEKKIYLKIKNQEYSDKDQLKKDKQKLVEFVGNKEIEKRINSLEKEVEKANSEEEKRKVKTKLSTFLHEDNIYVKNHENKIQNLIKKLEKNSNPTNNSDSFPWKIVLSLTVLGVVAVIGVVLLIRYWRRRQEENIL